MQIFYETMKSIEKYGGYYIGRYETGVEGRTSSNSKNGGKTVVRKMQYNDYSINYQTWYEAYAKNSELAGSNENVKTSMIWGNYRNATFNYIPAGAEEPEATATKSGSTRIPTGSAEYTKANNIYDMAGNVWEWTLEVYSTDLRIHRGGGYNEYHSNGPASNRGRYYPNTSFYGCRTALIITNVS